MKKYLLPPKKSYKANLHCHTNISDGKLSPKEVKEAYKANGYSIVAYTDHDILLPHPELRDEDFLPLNSFEAEFTEGGPKPFRHKQTCHLCFIALDEDNVEMPFIHRTKYLLGNAKEYAHLMKYDETLPDFERNHSPECINEAIRIARENGFFVTYNHPTWSLERFDTYTKYHGMNAVEIYNGSCICSGHDEYNSHVYDDMLMNGERIFCIGGDDNHNSRPLDHPRSDSGKAFTFIKADELSYKAVTDALLKGDCYASMGPEIDEIYYEDGYIVVKCPSAERISMSSGLCFSGSVWREKGKKLTTAKFEIKEKGTFYRITVWDKDGKVANSRAYFPDEIFCDE